MAEYSSKPVTLRFPIESVFEKVSNPQLIEGLLKNLPAEASERLDKISFDEQTVTFQLKGLPEITLRLSESVKPNKVVYSAEGSPMAFSLGMNLNVVSEQSTEVILVINIDVPVFMKPLISGHINKALEAFSERIGTSFSV